MHVFCGGMCIILWRHDALHGVDGVFVWGLLTVARYNLVDALGRFSYDADCELFRAVVRIQRALPFHNNPPAPCSAWRACAERRGWYVGPQLWGDICEDAFQDQQDMTIGLLSALRKVEGRIAGKKKMSGTLKRDAFFDVLHKFLPYKTSDDYRALQQAVLYALNCPAPMHISVILF